MDVVLDILDVLVNAIENLHIARARPKGAEGRGGRDSLLTKNINLSSSFLLHNN